MRIAIIDLGTNTFNLLIASVGSNGSYQTEMSTKHPVKLGKGGINSHTILPEAMREKHCSIFEANEALRLFPEEQMAQLLAPDNLLKLGFSLKELGER